MIARAYTLGDFIGSWQSVWLIVLVPRRDEAVCAYYGEILYESRLGVERELLAQL